MSLRFPGDISDSDQLWRALLAGDDLVTRIDLSRWAVDELQHPRRSESGRSITFDAGVLKTVGDFDAGFFGISPREAELMDPQQRLMLELAWEALEHAGIPPSAMAGTDCAVYLGISGLDYGMRVLDDLSSITAHMMTGNTMSVAANRLSYVLDLHGPSVAVDTACSSSLVALHQACMALRAGEASAALVGGVNLLLHPYPFVGFTKASMLSASGRCRAFAEGADGYVRAEGGGMLVLKPLSQAELDGDRILAVIRASGVNTDGARKAGLTIPSGAAQAELMGRVLERSGLTPADIDYLEAHGTGTRIGDPIEAGAIGTVYGRKRAAKLPIGSIKSNLGHMEAASGMAGLIKALMVLRKGIIPRSLHSEHLNEAIDFDGLGLNVARDKMPLASGRARRVAVNSFGFGGVNGHVILEGHPAAAPLHAVAPATALPLVISARDDAALRDLAGRYLPLLTDPSKHGALAHAAWTRRDWLAERVAIPDLGNVELRRGLETFAAGGDAPALVRERAMSGPVPVAFVYSGNGAQWTGMGRRLLQASPVFAEHMDQIAELVRQHGGPDILAVLANEDPATLDDTAIAQPALFALQVATTMLLREHGLIPSAVMGHSVGEIAAAWAAGALDLDMACLVIVARSQAQALTRGTGRMAAVGLGLEAMRAHLQQVGLAQEIEIAAENSPQNVTVSGPPEALAKLRTGLNGPFYRELNLDYAFHSVCMDPIQGQLAAGLEGLRTTTERIPFYSSITGKRLAGDALGAAYWWHNVRDPVRFGPALAAMAADGYRLFVEIGPNAILQRYITESLTAAGVDGRVLGTAPRREDTLETARATALRAALLGVSVDATAYFPAGPAPHVALPSYPWQRQRYWLAGTAESYALINRQACHELLGYRLKELPAAWEVHLDPLKMPALAEHKVGGAVVLPGAAYLEMALAASREWFGTASHIVEELSILAPVVFDGEHARTLRCIFSPTDLRFRIEGRQRLSDTPWTLHAQGRVLGAAPGALAPSMPLPAPGRPPIAAVDHYAFATTLGLEYGPLFRGIETLELDAQMLRGRLSWPDGVPGQGHYLLHPAVLDQCFQAVLGWFGGQANAPRELTFLPVAFGRLTFMADAGPAVELRARLLRYGQRSASADFELLDAQGRLVARLDTARFRAAALARHVSPAATWVTRAQLAPLPGDLPALPCGEVLLPELADLGGARDQSGQTRYFQEIAPLLEMLPLAYARDALRAGDAGLRQVWCDGHPLQRWLLALAKEEGLIQDGDDTVILDEDIPPTGSIWAAALADCPAVAPELLRIGRVGRQLVQNPYADCGTLSAILGAVETDDRNPVYAASNQAAVDALTVLLRHWPAGRPVRILDIGVGDDAMLARLRPILPASDLYYVLARTDSEIRAGLALDHADGDAEVVALDHADFSIAPGAYTPKHFDVVLVHHALHGVAQPARALREIRRYLAEDGVLLLTERYPDRASDFARGSDATWWHGEAKPHGSLLAPQNWTDLLEELGWRELHGVLDAAGSALDLGSFLLVARPAPQIVALDAPAPQNWALLTDQPGWQELKEATAEALRTSGQHVAEDTAQGHCDHWVIFPTAPSVQVEAGTLAHDCEALRKRLLEIARCAPDSRVWIVTQGGALHDDIRLNQPGLGAAAIWGMARSAANELHPLRLTLIDLPDASTERATRLQRELLGNEGESEIVLTQEARYVLRVVPADTGEWQTLAAGETASWRLDFTLPGQLRNLHWRGYARRELAPDEIEIEARAAGLNFRDVMYAMGLLADEALENGFAGPTLGLEVAGRVSRYGSAVSGFAVGDDVLAFAGASFASHVVVPARAVSKMPARWTYAEAATVPTVFFTVWYALAHLAHLRPGERILIHGAAGGVGLAAIQVARHLGAEIFASAGSDAKRDFVALLGADHVLDSRSPHFDQVVLDLTGGEGVDVVLNSLSGEAIQRNLRALKPFGRFIELGKRDFYENTAIGLRPFRNNISYFGVDADQLMLARPELATVVFGEVMALFAEGRLSPLPHRVFPADEVVDAFRHMQQARQIGKVVVDLTVAPRHVSQSNCSQKIRLNPNATYLVTGGLSGFGRATVDWLVERGARHLALASRRGMEAPGAATQIEALRRQGVNARVFACDVADRKGLAAVFDVVACSMPGLRGVVHAAMVLDDALLVNLDVARFSRVLVPKLDGAWNLHELTRHLPLDLFVLFSSATTLLGNPGQANYVAANAALEALALLRRQEGLAGCAVSWGPIADVGVLTSNVAARDALRSRLGADALDSHRALAQLDLLLTHGNSVATVMDFDWPTLQRMLPAAHEARFDELRRQLGNSVDTAGDDDLRLRIRSMSEAEARLMLIGILAEEIAEILRLPADRIGPAQSVFDLGMDSLMAVELALALEKRFGVTVPPMLINENPSLERIADRLLASLGGERGEDDTTRELVESIAAHHADGEILTDVGALVEQVREAAATGTRLIA
jgi:acyl transferase domain-containing protein/NADPH:quinone reductase-like Zn-dependent oxidoreductase/acyl carrier protein/SAM-dependent methyltransferase